MSYEREIAFKYLKKRRHGFFAFITTLIAIGGVAIGVAAMIIILSVMNGFRADIQEKTLGIQPHVVVSSLEKYSPSKINILENRLRKVREVEAVSPFVMGQILLKSKTAAQGIVVRGIVPSQEFKVTNVRKTLSAGSWDALENADGLNKGNPCPIVLGKELARLLAVTVGDTVWAVSPTETANLGAMGSIPKMDQFTVSGIFDAGFYEYDSSFAFIPLERARSVFSVEGASGIGIRVKNLDAAAQVAASMDSATQGYNCIVYPWQALNKNLFKALKLEKIMMSILLTIIIIIACFTIVSNLILMSIEKSRDIGILKALGASQKSIRNIFLYAGISLGLVGIILGAGLGLGITYLLGKTQLIRLPQDVYYLDHLPVTFSALDIFGVIAAAFLITVLAAIYPSMQASKTNPIDAIRYG